MASERCDAGKLHVMWCIVCQRRVSGIHKNVSRVLKSLGDRLSWFGRCAIGLNVDALEFRAQFAVRGCGLPKCFHCFKQI